MDLAARYRDGPGPARRPPSVEGADDLEKASREDATRIRAALAARLGDAGLVEEIVQDAFIDAFEHRRAEGVPLNPRGGLATTARRKSINRLRRERMWREGPARSRVPSPCGVPLPGGGAGEFCSCPVRRPRPSHQVSTRPTTDADPLPTTAPG